MTRVYFYYRQTDGSLVADNKTTRVVPSSAVWSTYHILYLIKELDGTITFSNYWSLENPSVPRKFKNKTQLTEWMIENGIF